MNVPRETYVGNLTARETQILDRILTYGETNKQIAAAFNCSTRTVEAHLRNIMNKTGVHRRWELASVIEGVRANG